MVQFVDVYVLLDVLLLILIALFIPIGFWRGAYREGFVTLGILFGSTVGTFWSEPWGMDLAAVTRLHESGGAFMVAMLALIGSTFLLGYSAGAALPVPHPGWIARTLGALIAAANGALLLSLALRDIRIYLLSGQDSNFLERAVIAPFLSEETGWVLVIGAAVFVPITLVIALFGSTVEYDEYYEDDEFEEMDDPIMGYSRGAVPVEHRPPSSDASERTPAPSYAEETRPIRSVDPSDAAPDRQPGMTSSATGQQQSEFSGQPTPGVDDGTVDIQRVDSGICPHCHADIRNAEGYCPSCGRLL